MSLLPDLPAAKEGTLSEDAKRCAAILEKQCAFAGISLQTLQLQQFGIYFDLLTETNKVMNLTALTSPQDVAVKHFIDSLLCYDENLMKGKKLIDVGTGAGFPGIPLKIFDPSLQLILLDSLEKRLKFLQEVVKKLQMADVSFVHMRAEDAGRHKTLRGQAEVAVSRAVARLSVLAEYCLPLVRKGGFFVALKGSKYKEEIAEAENAVHILGGSVTSVKEVELPGLNDGRAIIVVRKVKDTSPAYPRKAGLPGKSPLGSI